MAIRGVGGAEARAPAGPSTPGRGRRPAGCAATSSRQATSRGQAKQSLTAASRSARSVARAARATTCCGVRVLSQAWPGSSSRVRAQALAAAALVVDLRPVVVEERVRGARVVVEVAVAAGRLDGPARGLLDARGGRGAVLLGAVDQRGLAGVVGPVGAHPLPRQRRVEADGRDDPLGERGRPQGQAAAHAEADAADLAGDLRPAGQVVGGAGDVLGRLRPWPAPISSRRASSGSLVVLTVVEVRGEGDEAGLGEPVGHRRGCAGPDPTTPG